MMPEWRDLLWLLLPLAAASGWYAARHEFRRRDGVREKGRTPDYFRGINYLLNEQPDRAIEVFTQMMEVDTETVETHLALGSLFRRRGEVERAIRIHQNLIARPTLDREQRAIALCELAQDYNKAGLLDRAENLFLELAEIPAHAEQALRFLMSIYEQEKEWRKALAIGRRLKQLSSKPVGTTLAQYCCECAEQAIQAGDPLRARDDLRDALRHDPDCVRANLLLGRLAAGQGRWREAIRFWQAIEQQDDAYLDEVIPELVTAYRHVGDDAGLSAYLEKTVRQSGGVRALLAFTNLLLERDGHNAAMQFLTACLRDQPSLAGLQRLVALQIDGHDYEADKGIHNIKAMLDHLAEQQKGYQCRHCGFRGLTLHWQCPACHAWSTLQPLSCTTAAATPANFNPSKLAPPVKLFKS